MGFYDTLRDAYPDLSKGRKRIADYLMTHRNDAAFISAASLAQQTNLSEASIGRFATVLGYNCYKDMQNALQQEVLERMDVVTRIRHNVPKADDLDGIFQQILSDDLNNINRTCQNLDLSELDAIAQLLIKSTHIGVSAIRAGTSVGTILHLFLNQIIGKTISLYPGIFEARDMIKNWGENDTIIAILYYRNSHYLERLLEFAKKRKCKIIVFTNDLTLNVTSFADFVISPEVNGPIISYTSSVLVCNILLSIILKKIGPESQRILDEMSEYDDILADL